MHEPAGDDSRDAEGGIDGEAGSGAGPRRDGEPDRGTTPWAPYFGFGEPYEHQADAIEAAIEVGREGGYLAMEAPCGTGKTMAALTAAAYLLREGDRYDNVVVVTPVKQQLEQFVADLRTLNEGLEDPLTGVALVGKGDLCPYEREGIFPDDVGVNDRCEDLRAHTAELVAASAGDAHAVDPSHDAPEEVPPAPAVAVGGDVRGDDRWWDRGRAAALARAARPDAEAVDAATGTVRSGLRTAGATAPYRPVQPAAPEEMVDGARRPTYCPFEADWYARDRGSPVGFEDGEDHVVTSDEFLPQAVERGTCPHRVMGVLLGAADVVIGNYNHLFDPRTRGLTGPVLDGRTFVIVDEAHRLEGRVRSLLSDRIGRGSLRRAQADLREVLRHANQDPTNRDHVTTRLAEHGTDLAAVERVATFLEAVEDWLLDRVDRFAEGTLGPDGRPIEGDGAPDRDPAEDATSGGGTGDADRDRDRDLEIPLRDPSSTDRDELSAWAEARGDGAATWRSLRPVSAAAEAVLFELDPDRSATCTGVAARLERWWTADRSDFFREITLEYAPSSDGQTALDRPWRRWYTPALVLYNCIPSAELADVLGALGGGVLMSATLEPLRIFRTVTGLDDLATGEEPRPVVDRSYPLSFPPERRASWIVDAEPFTARNRGEPTLDNRNPVRERYAYVLRSVARGPGNVLVCMPSYREAGWAAARLEADEGLEKPVLLDGASSNERTTALRESFFSGGEKVLVTSTRGTLTEGVDYEGDHLHACVVVGVPLVNVGSPRVRAVVHAYGERFGHDAAFEYALTVPAVRRSRQAIGRVIRGPEERGVRVLADARYAPDAGRSVHRFLSPGEREEFVRMTPMFLPDQLDAFWSAGGGEAGDGDGT